jgi:sugar/nucleoside kinase (ribokinase family)
MAIRRGCSNWYNEHMGSSRCNKGKFYLSSFLPLYNTLYNAIARHSFFFLSPSEVLFSYVLQISEDEITFLIGGGDPYDDDVVLNKLFHPNLKLLIVTEGSKGCRYYTKVSLPKSFHYFLCSLF